MFLILLYNMLDITTTLVILGQELKVDHTNWNQSTEITYTVIRFMQRGSS